MPTPEPLEASTASSGSEEAQTLDLGATLQVTEYIGYSRLLQSARRDGYLTSGELLVLLGVLDLIYAGSRPRSADLRHMARPSTIKALVAKEWLKRCPGSPKKGNEHPTWLLRVPYPVANQYAELVQTAVKEVCAFRMLLE